MELDRTRLEVVTPLGRECYALVDVEGVVGPAEAALAERPRTLQSFLDLGRAYHRVWRYRDCVRIYSRAAELFPDEPLVYRHRGHRYINLRRIDAATTDLEQAAALDERSFDIWYHLGLARYLDGDFARAAEAYRACLACSETDDKVVATADWLYMTLRRLGRAEEAAAVLDRIRPDMDYGDNRAYFRRLLVYKGLRSPDELMAADLGDDDLQLATEGYGLGYWHLANGDTERAFAIFERIVQGRHWPAFGFVAAEAELARRGGAS